MDLVLARAPADEWAAADKEMAKPYAELGIELALWATRTALEAGNASDARSWLRLARDRAGNRRAWQLQISDLALHVGE